MGLACGQSLFGLGCLRFFCSSCGKQCLHAGLLALIVVPLSGDVLVFRFLQSVFGSNEVLI